MEKLLGQPKLIKKRLNRREGQAVLPGLLIQITKIQLKRKDQEEE